MLEPRHHTVATVFGNPMHREHTSDSLGMVVVVMVVVGGYCY